MNRDELAHELWAAAQLAPGEGISDAVARMNSLLAAQSAEAEGVDRSAITEEVKHAYYERKSITEAVEAIYASLSAVTAAKEEG